MRARKSYLVGENIPLDEFLLFRKGEVLKCSEKPRLVP